MHFTALKKLADLVTYVVKLNLRLPWRVLIIGALLPFVSFMVIPVMMHTYSTDFILESFVLMPYGTVFAVFCFSLKATFEEYQRLKHEGSRLYLECRQLFESIRKNLEGYEDLEIGDHPRVGANLVIFEDDRFEQATTSCVVPSVCVQQSGTNKKKRVSFSQHFLETRQVPVSPCSVILSATA